MSSTGRAARLTALALATGTLVAAGAGTAGATTTSTTNFTAQGGGSVLRLAINLPAGLSLPGIGSSLTQDLVQTGGSSRSGADVAAIANSVLGANGNVPVVSGLLDKAVTAQYGQPAPASVNAFPDALSPLGITGKLLALNSAVSNPNVDGVTSSSESAVADFRVDGAGNVTALINALVSQLTAAINAQIPANNPLGLQLPNLGNGSVAPVTTSLTDLVQNVASQALALANSSSGGATSGLSQQAQNALKQVSTLLNGLVTNLGAQLQANAADTSLLSVGLIKSTQTINRSAGVVTSATHNVLTDIKVLGGLVTVSGLSSDATAALGNGISTATETAGNQSLVHVNVSNLLSLDVTSQLQAILGSGVLPADLTSQLNGVLAQVTGVLTSLLNPVLTPGAVTKHITNPNQAASEVSAARFTLDPLAKLAALGVPVAAANSQPLVALSFVPATAEVDQVKAESVAPPAVIGTTPAAAQSLPRTGADLPLTAAAAAGLMGLAAALRRRRMSHLSD